jgi:uncharacterized protein YkwD
MLLRRVTGVVLVVTWALASTASAHAVTQTCANAGASPDDANAAAEAVTCLVNQQRQSRGLDPVTRQAQLDDAAHDHSADMVRHDRFSHTGSDGSDLRERFHAAGWGVRGQWRAGEAIGWGTKSLATPQAIVDAFLNSPPHRRILLDPGFELLGVGVVHGAPAGDAAKDDGATYTLDFAETTN